MSIPTPDELIDRTDSAIAQEDFALAKTAWVEAIRLELATWACNTEHYAYPDEKALISSMLKDLGILSHNLAAGRTNPGEFVLFADYHYENANTETQN